MTTQTDAEEITREEGRELLEVAARQWLNLTRHEFIKAWDDGAFIDDERLGVQQVAMLLPFGRP